MISIGVVGAGLYGRMQLEAFRQRERLAGDMRVAGFAEIDEAARLSAEADFGLRGYGSIGDLLRSERLDCVSIVTPDHLHHAPAMECLLAGKHVFVEKPLAASSAEAAELAATAAERNLLLQVDFHKRFDPYHIDLKLRLEEGGLGALQYGYFWMEDVLRVGTEMIGRPHWGMCGSPVWFLGTHMVDLSCWLMGFPEPLSVYANGGRGKLSSLGLDMYDSVKAQVLYANGVSITYDTTLILPDSFEAVSRQGLKLVGTEGLAEIDSQYRGARACTTADGMRTFNSGGFGRRRGDDGGIVRAGYIYESIVDFIDNVRQLSDGKSLDELAGRYASADEALHSTRIGEAVHHSMESGDLVKL